jgi:ankyrin repeat protein
MHHKGVVLCLLAAGIAFTQPVHFTPRVDLPVSGRPAFAAAGDFNGDRKPDLVVTNVHEILLLAGNGDGTFQLPVRLATLPGVSAVAGGDLNGDGIQDLAVTSYRTDSVSILLGDGKGGFRVMQSSFPVGARPGAVALGDFDGDGHLDIVTANYDPERTSATGTVSLLYGNGDGTFLPAVTLSVGDRPFSLAVADLDGDGKPDIAVCNERSRDVSVLWNRGDGTFLPAVNYRVGIDPVSIVAADFNSDGRLDLAVANLNSSSVSVLLGRGNRGFGEAHHFPTGSHTGPFALAAADFNGDAVLDLAVANYADGVDSVSILPGNGDGTFRAPVAIAVGRKPHALVAADFDGSGGPGLAVVNEYSGTISILRNNRGAATGSAPLAAAVRDNRPGEVRRLIAAGADVNARDDRGFPILLTAALAAGPEVVRLLLDAGAHLAETPPQMRRGSADLEDAYMPVVYLIVKGQLENVRRLLASGADASHRVNERSLTQYAGEHDWAAIVDLLDRAARPRIAPPDGVRDPDGRGYTPLMVAAAKGDRAAFERLLAAGADWKVRTASHTTMLMFAAQGGNAAIIDSLLRLGAKSGGSNAAGWTAVMYAAARDDAATVRKLVEAGESPFIPDEDAGGDVQKALTPEMRAILR